MENYAPKAALCSEKYFEELRSRDNYFTSSIIASLPNDAAISMAFLS
jgi:hypothetical protein